MLVFCLLDAARAVPSFAQQTGQSCSQCHVGAFGPQLKPYGRDFKLYGYTSSDGQKHLPPIALTLQTSFTHTVGGQPGLVAEGFKPNDNFSADQQVSAYYAGRIAYGVGAFVQVTYNGTAGGWTWDNLDIRYAHSTQILGQDTVFGITVNNSPTVQDLWNSTPSWGFPYNSSSLAPTPLAATLADGALAEQVFGAGVYAMWNDTLYLEAAVYHDLNESLLERLISDSVQGEETEWFKGNVPYGRIAIEHATDNHYVQAGAFAFTADRYPAGSSLSGNPDYFVDRAFDANYQFTGSKTHFVSAHAIYIHENEDLRTDQFFAGTHPNDNLHTFRADVSYSFRDTWTPSVQIFHTGGSNDRALWGTANGSPDTRGYVAEIAYVPLGKPKSSPQWMNARLGVQYVGYQVFDGTASQSSKNNTLYLSLWVAAAPFYAMEKSFWPKGAAR